jgi:hypothetical protein
MVLQEYLRFFHICQQVEGSDNIQASLLLDMDDPPLSANYLSAISYASHGHGDQRVDLRCHPRAPCLAGGNAIGLSATDAYGTDPKPVMHFLYHTDVWFPA